MGKLKLRFLHNMYNEAVKRGEYTYADELKELIFEIENSKPKGFSNKAIFGATSLVIFVLIINLLSK